MKLKRTMTISILGCGWLGLPLAQHLIDRGHNIKGSTTSLEKLELLEENNIRPFLIKLTPEIEHPESVQPFWNSEVLVINIPPGRRRENVIAFHTAQIYAVNNAIRDSSIEFVVFISSTSVYPKSAGLVTENDAIPGKAKRTSGNALLKAERILTQNPSFKTTIVRFGGLIGYDRHPVNYLSAKKELKRANAPVNLIHRDDCIKIMTRITENSITGEVFNAVHDNHPTREKYYLKAAKKLGMEPPQFKKDDKNGYKIVSNKKLKSRLNYNFNNNLL
jgi:nucleoside-diphosphate-sugar epimerase